MVVYLSAFALTILFIQRAAFYYKKIQSIKSISINGNVSQQNVRQRIKHYKLEYCLFFLLAFFPLFFIAAVRYDVGTDYFYTYVPNFLKILKGESPYSEWGFNLLNRFIQLFTTNPQWLFVVTAFIFTFLIIQTIVRYSSSVSISVVVVLLSSVFFIFLNNMRQLIAVVLFFRAFPYIKKGEFIKYAICVLLGCLFHISAIVMIIPCIVVNLKFIRKNFLFFIVLITLLLPILAMLVELVLINTKYRYFFLSNFNNGNATTVNIVYNLVFFILSYLVLYKRIKTDKYAYVLLFMQFLSFWVSAISLFVSISEMVSRFTLYFQIFQILLVPYCYKVGTNTAGKNFYLASYIFAYGLYIVYFIIINGYHHVLPYQWIF